MNGSISIMGKQINPPQKCRAIGNLVACLYYLSKEANRADLKDLAEIIDRTIGDAIYIGQEELASHLRQAATDTERDGLAFLDSFCGLNDDAALLEIREILSTYADSKKERISGIA